MQAQRKQRLVKNGCSEGVPMQAERDRFPVAARWTAEMSILSLRVLRLGTGRAPSEPRLHVKRCSRCGSFGLPTGPGRQLDFHPPAVEIIQRRKRLRIVSLNRNAVEIQPLGEEALLWRYDGGDGQIVRGLRTACL